MFVKHIKPSVYALFVLAIVVSACSAPATAEPTPTSPPPTATALPSPTATITPKPTKTPKPTATPNLAATKEVEDALSRVQSYVDSGYLSSTEGELFKLDDLTWELAQIDYLNVEFAGYEDKVRDFAVWAEVAWESAGPVRYPQYSGCGFSFRINPNNFDGYTAMLTNDRVLLTFCDESINRCGEVGKTRGSGRLKFDNPAQASMELIVNDIHAYVLVDGEFIGEYTLSTSKLLDPGYLLYSIISGTNRDYGVRCEMKNSTLWIADSTD